ncbi:hypothetical protein [Enterococcus mundtii]|uniref:hypothetical protein n=1 Tax=Enterococcus mundtii TaxID=53346 RepID=UPI000F7D061C|nr:hypothetical protein [Enterococcus mundtii]AZP93515.1 hypothetical protein CYK55_10720 [Enterococcus mundtii]MBE9910004.1 hypothetical protein [Enterococcus mundtii]MDK4210206.1 hypothetical protein [Enterococcus mundtii]MRI73607.1 hypothetical protein [Enterococcus mundtii]
MDKTTELKPIEHDEYISLRVSGNQMTKSEGYNLEYVLTSLNSTESMIKKSYLHIKGGTRFTKEDKQYLNLKIMEFKEGSLIYDLMAVYSDIIIPTIPVIAGNKELIWTSIKASYEFLKTKISAAKEGKELVVNQTTDTGGANVSIHNVTDSTVEVNIYPGIDKLANNLAADFYNLAKKVDGEQLEAIEFTNTVNNEQIYLTTEDRELFSKSTYTEDSIVKVSGKVYGSDYLSKTGKIEIIETSDPNLVCGETYPFKGENKLGTESTWKQMYLEKQTYFCKKRIEINTTKDPIINVLELIIVDIDNQMENVELV